MSRNSRTLQTPSVPDGAARSRRSRRGWTWVTVAALSVAAGLGALAAIWGIPWVRHAAPSSPAGQALQMAGDVGSVNDPTHDPTLFEHDGSFYVFSTGELRSPSDPGGIYARTSEGSLGGPWESMGELPVPEWTQEYGHSHLWAPHVVERDGVFHMYYAASSFGSNTSAIGLMTSDVPGDLGSWEDRGPVLTSRTGDDYNAIDPHVFEADGSWWITYGSHWEGIFLHELSDMGEPAGERHHLAARPGVQHNPIEAPTIFQYGDHYYLLTSWDRCCAGVDSTYRIAVGRADSVTGRYVDRDGQHMLEGGGTVILASRDDLIGPGGQDVLLREDGDYLVHHFYDGAADGTIRMEIRRIAWEDGWPVVDIDSDHRS